MSSNDFLDSVVVEQEIFTKFPTYSALVATVSNISGEPSNKLSEDLLIEAEEFIKALTANTPLEEQSEILVWRNAYSEFGVKPRVGRSSVEALARRAEAGLPRIDFLTDIYNAISVKHLIPIGGENLDKYQGAPMLYISNGSQTFETISNGELVSDQPEVGEIVWGDAIGVTCRRWNWRQCVRTRLDLNTTNALFIFDGLGENSKEKVEKASRELFNIIKEKWPAAKVASRVISA
jgi:DNA/RNA-binding domain of Phe-tRNA-synthetase-like protein